MALRYLSMILALGLLITSGCKSSSNYRPTCAQPCGQPAVVATTPVAPCPTAPVPPPPGAVVVPR